MRATKRTAGFSITELVVVVAIVSLLSALLTGSMAKSQTFAGVEMSRGAAEGRFQHTLDQVRGMLAIGRVEDPIESGTRVRFMTPIDPDGDGVTYDATGAVTWGSTVGGVAVAGAARFVAYVVTDLVLEQHLDLDLDGDGDLLDGFEVGRLEEQTPDGTRIALTPNTVLQRPGNPGGDVDGDGQLDPVFTVVDAGRSRLLTMRLFAIHRLPNGKWQRVAHEVSTRLQNDAQ
jgi:prepilin-type N-terminal cleavage/methylation domain-containing protein